MLKSVTGLALRTYWQIKAAPYCSAAWIRNAINEPQYDLLSPEELKATPISDTVFVFGSGYSINNITNEQWHKIGQHNTISFREFPRQNFIRADYHISGEVDFLEPYAQRIIENPLYENTIFVVQKGWSAIMGNNLIGKKLLRKGSRLFRFHRISRGQYSPPSKTFENGLVHGYNSSIGVVNFAYIMGWKNIVLAGIDLNDKRYFWLKSDEMRTYEKPGLTIQSKFSNADNIVSLLGAWTKRLSEENIQLYTLNPNSLLANVMPTYQLAT